MYAYNSDENPTTEVSCTRFSDPICETKHKIAQKYAYDFIEDFKLCNCITFKGPHISEVYDHYDTA